MGKKFIILLVLMTTLSLIAGFAIGSLLENDTVEEAAVETVEVPEEETKPAVSTPAKVREAFRADLAMQTVSLLSATIGSRVEGTSKEKSASDELLKKLKGYGLSTAYQQPYTIYTNGASSSNVIARVKGKNPDYVVVVGGHYDSKSTTPGANDNASGAACVVELARVFAANGGAYPTLEFVLFGGEEDPGDLTNHVDCHFGSRSYVAQLSYEQNRSVIGMISLDMVGYGDALYARYMEIGPMQLVSAVSSHANLPLRKGGSLSDHEPFEKAGIPSVWLEFMIGGSYDPHVHKLTDDYNHVNPNDIQFTGDVVQGFLESLDEASCQALAASRH